VRLPASPANRLIVTSANADQASRCPSFLDLDPDLDSDLDSGLDSDLDSDLNLDTHLEPYPNVDPDLGTSPDLSIELLDTSN
jgi:hypothetical protein